MRAAPAARSFAFGFAYAGAIAAAAAQTPQFVATSPSALAAQFTEKVAIGDFDRDGAPDLCLWALSSAPGSPLRLVRNDGLGGFTTQPPLPVNFFATAGFVFVDFDGDGDQDLFVSWPGFPGGNTTLLRYSNGLWSDATSLLPPMATLVPTVVADLDGDGDLDIAGAGMSIGSGAAGILVNLGGTFAFASAFGGQQGTLTAADIDGDGDLDLVRGGNPMPNLSLNDGTGHFTLATNRLPPMAGITARAAVADLDRDGDLDIVLACMGQANQVLWNRHRHIAAPTPPTIGQNWTVEVSGQPGYGGGTRGVLLGIGLARLPQAVPVPPFGALWLDLGAPITTTAAWIAPGAGPVPLVFAIPNAPQLVGITLHAQTLVEESAGTGDMRLTSLLSATIQ